MDKRLGFVGAGAMGSFVGGMLARADYDVTLIDAWPEHIKAIKEQGLLITGTHGRNTVGVRALHIHQFTNLPCAAGCRIHFDEGLRQRVGYRVVKDYLAPGSTVVSLQNGFNEELSAGCWVGSR